MCVCGVGGGGPCRRGGVLENLPGSGGKFCPSHKGSLLLADRLKAGTTSPQCLLSQVPRQPGQLCVYVDLPFVRVAPGGLRDNDFCRGLLEEVGFSKSESFLAC